MIPELVKAASTLKEGSGPNTVRVAAVDTRLEPGLTQQLGVTVQASALPTDIRSLRGTTMRLMSAWHLRRTHLAPAAACCGVCRTRDRFWKE